MMRSNFAVLLLASSIALVAGNNYTQTFKTTEYRFFKNQILWPEAKVECEKNGGHLVTIDNVDEFKYLLANLIELNIPRVWIGLNDIAKEGEWRWVNGDNKGGYINFGKGEPNDAGNEDCVEFATSFAGYNDLPCSKGYLRRRGYVCEIE